MCEAFSELGMDVTLFHIPSPTFDENIFQYYDVEKQFTLKSLPRGLLPFRKAFHLENTSNILSAFHGFLWSGFVSRLASGEKKVGFYYTREPMLAFWLSLFCHPVVLEVHNLHRGESFFIRKACVRSKVSLFITITEHLKQLLISLGVPGEKIITLHDGVDARWTSFSEKIGQTAARERLGLPIDRPIIGYTGSFYYARKHYRLEKGIPELIQAMACLPSINGKEPLLICVGGPMEAVPSYLELSRQTGVPQNRIQFVDHVENREIPYWIRAFDIAAAPYPNLDYYAYFMSPLKIFEYMAVGTPIIATELPSIQEVLTHKHNAYLVKPGDPQALAAGIEVLLKDAALRRQLGEQAASDARKFTWRERAKRIIDEIKRRDI
jgi:glycosyltransferase involved in cell wall biosynthesis